MTESPDAFDHLQALREEAAAWLVRVQSDSATDEDWRALGAWLANSDQHRLVYAELEELSHEISSEAEGLKALLRRKFAAGGAGPGARRSSRRRWWALPMAAGVALGAGLLWQAGAGRPAHYETGLGQTREVALADGSHIRMNAATTMDVRLGWRSRHVALGAGEASFDVTKDPGRPFLIDVADERVRVVGTAFNIRHYDGLFVLTVSRGIVEASREGGSAPPARMGAGQQLRRRDGVAGAQLSTIDPQIATAWTQGRLICVERPLREIVADLNRQYRTPITLGPAGAGARFSGVIEMGDEAEVVRRLGVFLNLPIRRTQGGFTLG